MSIGATAYTSTSPLNALQDAARRALVDTGGNVEQAVQMLSSASAVESDPKVDQFLGMALKGSGAKVDRNGIHRGASAKCAGWCRWRRREGAGRQLFNLFSRLRALGAAGIHGLTSEDVKTKRVCSRSDAFLSACLR